jgi:hypothetical protein
MNLEGRKAKDRGLIWGPGGTEENRDKLQVGVVGVPAVIRTGYPQDSI